MFILWLQKIWNTVREPFVLLKPIRFVVIPLTILLWALMWSSEGQDSIRAVVEFDRNCPHWGAVAWFIVCVSLLALQSWYWSRQLLRINFPQCGNADASEPGLQRAKTTEELANDYSVTQTWTPRFLGMAAFLIAIGALLRTAWLDYAGRWDYTTTVIAITIAFLVVMMILFIVFVVRRRARVGRSPRVGSQSQLATSTRYILRFTLLVALLFVIWTALSPLTAGVVFPSPSMLMISAALWIGIGSWIIYWADLYRVPIIAILLFLAFAFSFFNDNHAVRKLAPDAGGGNPIARKDINTTFSEWLVKLRAKYPAEQPTHPLYIVVTEGGGIRAAYWTASVLTALQDAAPQFSDHVFAISGVSGGSLGAATFTSLVADRNRASAVSDCDTLNKPDNQKSFRFAAQQALSYDFLAPTLASLLHADLVQRFLPIGFIPDRAKALETGWERGWRTHVRTASGGDDEFFSEGFVKMYADSGNALVPSLFLNGTIVEEGRRTITSNCLIGTDIPDSSDTLIQLGSDVRLSTAAHNSARFTYVSPAGSILNPSLTDHVVDGGYFENSGGQTAADVIRRLPLSSNPDVAINLILIRFQEVETNGRVLPPPGPTRFANEVLSPLRALLNVRGAHATLAYSEVERLPLAKQYEFLLTQEKHGIVLPLGWLLAQRTRSNIDEQIGPDVPETLSAAVKPFVVRNAGFLKAIAAELSPSGALPAAKPDSVQQEATQSEKRMKQP